MKANLNDLMNIVQMVKPEQRQRTTLKFVGETSFSALSNYDVITEIFPSKKGETGLEHIN